LLAKTYEDEKPLFLPKDREIHFGQEDHVRIYGLHNFVERLNQSGFENVQLVKVQRWYQYKKWDRWG
jgi:hypothetical protein